MLGREKTVKKYHVITNIVRSSASNEDGDLDEYLPFRLASEPFYSLLFGYYYVYALATIIITHTTVVSARRIV